jgi:hypothetical protein
MARGRLVNLDQDECALWVRTLFSSTIEELHQWADKYRIMDFEDRLLEMESRRLIIKLENEAHTVKLLNLVRMTPIGAGVRNVGPEYNVFEIRAPESQTLVRLDALGFFIYGFCDGAISLRESCDRVSTTFELSLDKIILRAARLLPELMVSRLVFLDFLKRGISELH